MKYQVMPDLTPLEYEALKADIAQRGVLVPVEVDENGDILDGHHRVRAWEELRTEGVYLPAYSKLVRTGWTEDEKFNHAYKLNLLHRTLTREQRDEAMRALRARGATYQEIAAAVGVSVQTAHNVAAESLNSNCGIENTRGQVRPATYAPRQPAPPSLFVSGGPLCSGCASPQRRPKLWFCCGLWPALPQRRR